jgi:hypothetical protein
MPRADGRIEPGQPLRGAISARAWNRAQDAADLVLGSTTGVEAGIGQAGSKPYAWVLCKPSVNVDRWGVLAITGVEIAPTANATDAETKRFEEQPVVTGGTPSATTTAWCVAVEPIAAGKIGRVAVGGVVQCKVTVSDSAHKFVRAKASTTELESSTTGEGLLLWSGGGWALVRLGTVDLTKCKDYSATKQQVLGHAANGGIAWIDTTACT